MGQPFVIYGAGGHGKVVLDIARGTGMNVDLIVDGDSSLCELSGCKVTTAQHVNWSGLQSFRFVVAIGNNPDRKRIFLEMQMLGGCPLTLIHPFSAISPSAQVGAGVAICAGAIINPGASVGDNCIINTSASVDHDCVVGAHSHICPGVRLAGNVRVGSGTMVGTGASVLPGVQIGEACQIGAGAVVTRDVPPHVVAVGVPARALKSLRSNSTDFSK